MSYDDITKCVMDCLILKKDSPHIWYESGCCMFGTSRTSFDRRHICCEPDPWSLNFWHFYHFCLIVALLAITIPGAVLFLRDCYIIGKNSTTAFRSRVPLVELLAEKS